MYTLLFSITSYLITISSFAIGFFVFIKRPKDAVNISWAIFSLILSIDALQLNQMVTAKDEMTAIFWGKLALPAGFIIPLAYLHFVYFFLDIYQARKKALFFLDFSVLFFIFYFIKSPGLFISEVAPIAGLNFYNKAGPLYFSAFLLYLFFSFLVCWELYLAVKKREGLKKTQIKYLLFCSIIGYGGGLTTYLPPFGLDIFPFGWLLVPIAVSILGYLVLRYKFLVDVEIIIRKGVFFSLLVFLIATFFTMVIFWGSSLIGSIFKFNLFFLALAASMTIAFTFHPLERFLENLTENIFFKGKYDYQKTLQEVSQTISSIHDLDSLSYLLMQRIPSIMKIEKALLLFSQGNENKFVSKTKEIMLPGFLISGLLNNRDPLLFEELESESAQQLKSSLQEDKLALILPVILRERLLAILFLGEKLSGDMFTNEDLALLSTIVVQAAVTIENINLLNAEKETARKLAQMQAKAAYNEILEEKNKELEKINKELQETQGQLIRSERLATFTQMVISLNHEINNPLTTILANLYILKKHSSSFPNQFRESLEMIEKEARRIKDLVASLKKTTFPAIEEYVAGIKMFNLRHGDDKS